MLRGASVRAVLLVRAGDVQKRVKKNMARKRKWEQLRGQREMPFAMPFAKRNAFGSGIPTHKIPGTDIIDLRV